MKKVTRASLDRMRLRGFSAEHDAGAKTTCLMCLSNWRRMLCPRNDYDCISKNNHIKRIEIDKETTGRAKREDLKDILKTTERSPVETTAK